MCAVHIVIVVCSSSLQIYGGWGCPAASSLSVAQGSTFCGQHGLDSSSVLVCRIPGLYFGVNLKSCRN